MFSNKHYILEDLNDLANNLSTTEKQNLIADSLEYYNTQELKPESFHIKANFDEPFFDEIDVKDSDLTETTKNELSIVLSLLEDLKRSLLFYKFDVIRIYRNGIGMIEIKMDKNNTNRAMILETKNFKTKIINLLSTRTNYVTYALSIAFTVLIAFLVKDIFVAWLLNWIP